MNKYFIKGKRAKELVGIYKNPYRQGTQEHDNWKLGFDSTCYESMDYEVTLEDNDSFIDEYEPLNIK